MGEGAKEEVGEGAKEEVGEGMEKEDGIDGVLSSDPQSWEVVMELLGGLLCMGRLLGTQGDSLRALKRAREGAFLARRMGLGTWSVSLSLFLSIFHYTSVWLFPWGANFCYFRISTHGYFPIASS